jgi:hypothetical protein
MSFETDTINGFIRRKAGDFESNTISSPNRNLARVAGVFYLVMIVCGMAAQVIRGNLIVPGNGVATTGNIMASESLFRVAFISDLFMATVFLLFAWVLYVLLKPVNKNIALLFVLLATASVAILSLNLLNQFAILILLSDAGYLAAFGAVQLNAMVMLFADLQYYGYYIAQISFGLWLVPLGYLVIKSGFLPRILGVLLIIAAFGHLSGFLAAFLLPGFESFADLAAALEIPFGLWLLVKGVKSTQPAKKPNKQTAIS